MQSAKQRNARERMFGGDPRFRMKTWDESYGAREVADPLESRSGE